MTFNWNVRYISVAGVFINQLIPNDLVEAHLIKILQDGIFEQSLKLSPDLDSNQQLEETVLTYLRSKSPTVLRYFKDGLLVG